MSEENDVLLPPGTTVRLKSGGPVMTVNGYLDDARLCAWFDEHHRLENGEFSVDALEPAERDSVHGTSFDNILKSALERESTHTF